MDEYTQLIGSAAMMVVGAYGVWRRRSTAASLYLDARVWWKRNIETRISALQAEATGTAGRYDPRVTRLAEGTADDAAYDPRMDDRSGQLLRSWQGADGEVMLAVGADAPVPASAEEVAEFQRAECPFVHVSYVNSAGSECTLTVDPALWYRRAGLGLPKFTQAEVRYLHSRAANAVIWTDEYTIECMTAEGREVALTQDQVFWSGPRSAKPVVVVEEVEPPSSPTAAASSSSSTSSSPRTEQAAVAAEEEATEEEWDAVSSDTTTPAAATFETEEDWYAAADTAPPAAAVTTEVMAVVEEEIVSAVRRSRSSSEDSGGRDNNKRRRIADEEEDVVVESVTQQSDLD